MAARSQGSGGISPQANEGGISSKLARHASSVRRTGAIFIAVTFALLTWLAFRQDPSPDPYNTPSLTSWEGLRRPIEWNAPQRLITVDANLRAVCTLKNTDHVWVAGSGGLVLHSSDAGVHWTQLATVTVPAKPDASKTRGATGAMARPLPGSAVADARDATNALDGAQLAAAPADKGQSDRNDDAAADSKAAARNPAAQTAPSAGDGRSSSDPRRVPLEVRSISFCDESNGWVTGDGMIMRTADGGKTWAQLDMRVTVDKREVTAAADRVALFSPSYGMVMLGYESAWALLKDNQWTAVKDPVMPAGTAIGKANFSFTLWDRDVPGDGWTFITTDAQKVHLHQLSEFGKRQTERGSVPAWIANDVVDVRGDGGSALHLTHRGGVITRVTLDGKPPLRQFSGAYSALQGVSFADPQRGWVVGDDGTILRTIDGGTTWHRQSAVLLKKAAMAERGEVGIAMRADGPMVRTRDGGRHWVTTAPTTNEAAQQERVWDLQMPTDRVGFAAGRSGVLTTSDGGEHWLPTNPHQPVELDVLSFSDAQQGWAIGGSPFSVLQGSPQITMFRTQDGGQNWPEIAAPGETPRAIFFLDATTGWTLLEDGSIARTSDGAKSFRLFGKQSDARAICFSDAQHGWLAGRRGLLLRSVNGGSDWTPLPRPCEEDLIAVRFARDGLSGSLVTQGGTVLTSIDGGATWSRPAYRIIPGPWYWLASLALVGMSIALISWTPEAKAPPPNQSSVAQVFVSDSALKHGEYDALGMGTIAAGLSDFLRNERTPPPLTVAITGDWGTGKSSLMNLLAGDLAAHGFSPVAFNAWHHQKEEQVLAALLEAIRAEAIPPWYTRAGMLFRIKLLRLRARRNWLPLTVVLLLVCGCLGYLSQGNNFDRASNDIARLSNRVVERLDALRGTKESPPARKSDGEGKDVKTQPADAARFGTYGLFAASVLTLIGAVHRALKAFGIEPAELLAGKRAHATRGDVAASSSFRARFAHEFAEVAEALDPRTMLILIDDLDRCRPESVLEILEAVNFLVSNGKVFVVLGMAPSRVIPAIGLAFKGVAEEMSWTPAVPDPKAGPQSQEKQLPASKQQKPPPSLAPEPGPPGVTTAPRDKDGKESDRAHQDRQEFARNYLEKLINIEVPVPRLEQDRCFSLLMGHGDDSDVDAKSETPDKPVNWKARVTSASETVRSGVMTTLDTVRRIASRGITWIVLGAVLFFVAGKAWHQWVERAAPAETRAAAATTASGEPATQPEPRTPPVKDVPTQRPTEPGRMSPQAADAHVWRGWGFLVGVPILLLCGWLLWTRDEPVTHDSRGFEEALKDWSQIIAAAHPTPRRVKRFLNRIRYVAMLRRAGLAAKESGSAKTADKLDAHLVAIGTLQSLFPKLVEDAARWGALDAEQVGVALADLRLPPGVPKAAIVKALNSHREAWGWPIDKHALAAWHALEGQVVVH